MKGLLGFLKVSRGLKIDRFRDVFSGIIGNIYFFALVNQKLKTLIQYPPLSSRRKILSLGFEKQIWQSRRP